MFSFNVSANNTNVKSARVISPVAYGGTPWSRRAFSPGHGVSLASPTRVSLPTGVNKLSLLAFDVRVGNGDCRPIRVRIIKRGRKVFGQTR